MPTTPVGSTSPSSLSSRASRGDRRRGRVNLVALTAVIAFGVLYSVVSLLWPLPWWIAAIYLGTSVVTFVIYAVDKSAARSGRWRVSESTLLSIGLVGGWPGAVLAQQLLRHKTKKLSFGRAFWATVLLNVVAFVVFATPLRELIVAQIAGS
jgi:uncharacterized membrane protein YsdA (DUF1294 family)